jgi:hypothetical protein
MQQGADIEELSFTYTFEQPTILSGIARATLYMSCAAHDDMDVFVQLRKADKDGGILQHLNIPLADLQNCGMEGDVPPVNPLVHLGPSGCLRASFRAPDDALSFDNWSEHDYSKADEKIVPGSVVRLDIGLWQTGMGFERGEKLVLKVAGHNMTLAEFPPLCGQIPNYNKGMHDVHVGGKEASFLVLPIIDPNVLGGG